MTTPALLSQLRQYVSAEAYRQLAPDDLWLRFRNAHDELAFRVLLERIGPRVFARCRAILRNDDLAEEAFQDTFRDLFRKRERIATYQKAAAWAYQAATNHARHLRRKQRRWWFGEMPEPATVPASPDDAEAVGRLLAGLPDRYRRPLELVYWNGLTHAEAAAVLGWSKGTVDSYVARGLKRLKAAAGKAGLAAAVVSTEAVLTKPAAALSDVVLTNVLNRVWPAGGPVVTAGPWWATGWTKAAVALAAFGVAAAGGEWWGAAEDIQSLPPRPESPPAGLRESVSQRNLRVFQDMIAARVEAALREVVIGGGDVTREQAEAFDTRIDCVFILHHRLGGAAGWRSRVRLIRDADVRETRYLLDFMADGNYRGVDPRRPIVLWRDPLTRKELVLPLSVIDRIEAAFAPLPKDEWSAAEAADQKARLLDAFGRYVGVWHRRGDPARRCAITLPGGNADLATDDGAGCSGWWRFRVQPDGRLVGLWVFDSPAEFSADGTRIDFPLTNDWWVRPAPAKR